MSFSEAVRSVYRQYATFSGRASRAEYWWFQLFFIVVTVGLVFAGVFGAAAVPGRSGAGPGPFFWVTFAVVGIFGLLTFIPELAVSVRRLHDTDRSGWWYLITFVPYVGSLILLVFMILPGTPGNNRYGPEPGATGVKVQYTGPTQMDAMQAFHADAQRAAAQGYQPQWQEWRAPSAGQWVLEVTYTLVPPQPQWNWAPPPPPPAG